MSPTKSYARLRETYTPTRLEILRKIVVGNSVTTDQSGDTFLPRSYLSSCLSPRSHVHFYGNIRTRDFWSDIGTPTVLRRSYVTCSEQCNEKANSDNKANAKECEKVKADEKPRDVSVEEPPPSTTDTSDYLQMKANCPDHEANDGNTADEDDCPRDEDDCPRDEDECEPSEPDDPRSVAQDGFFAQLPPRLDRRCRVPIRDSAPAIQAMRNFFLGRQHSLAVRAPDDMAPHTRPPPCMPLGPHFKYAENYYCSRDGGREVKPPTVIEGKYVPRMRTKTLCDERPKKISDCVNTNSTVKPNEEFDPLKHYYL